MSTLRKPFSLALALASVTSSALALGIRVPDQDARAIARGNAFVATADNPSAIYYNPAGITQLEGMNSRVGLYSIYIKDHYSSGSTSLDSKDAWGFLPQVFSTVTPKDSRFSFGFGTYSPYGLSMEWPSSAPFHFASRQGSMMTIAGNAVVAWKIADNFSIAAGPTIMWSKTRLEQDNPAPPGDIRLRGDGFGYGATAGLLWKPHEQHAFGVSYRSGMSTDWGGSLNTPIPGITTRPANAEFDFPHTIVGGWSFRPTPKWNLEFNLDWTDWSCVRSVAIRTTPPAPAPLVFNWQNSFMYQFGATRDVGKGFAVSAGYIFSENSVPAATFKPTVPDSDRHVFSVGLGHHGKKVSWDVAYQFAYGPERTISGAPLLGGGNYTFYSHALACSFGYRF
ncbi:MAG: outer membrane protein transport protein [Verrucomicrobia bacterium]|nr:outer membrane protein transport protein [Verrucomicrobiota bacterium]